MASNTSQTQDATLAQPVKRNEVLRDMLHYSALYYLLYPFELLFVILAQVCVLHRMQLFSNSSSWSAPRQRHVACAWRAFVALLVAGILVGIGSNIATAVFFSQAADFNTEALKALALNHTAPVPRYEQQAKVATSRAVATASLQRLSEAAVLLMFIAVYCIVGIRSYRIITTALRTLLQAEQRFVAAKDSGAKQTFSQQRQLIADASDQGRTLLLKVVVTFVLVFVSILVRSLFHVLYAVAQAGQDYANPCALSQCSTCKNVFSTSKPKGRFTF
jgi:hypothetical protein